LLVLSSAMGLRNLSATNSATSSNSVLIAQGGRPLPTSGGHFQGGRPLPPSGGHFQGGRPLPPSGGHFQGGRPLPPSGGH
jgi:hypothetical protein